MVNCVVIAEKMKMKKGGFLLGFPQMPPLTLQDMVGLRSGMKEVAYVGL